MTTTRQALKSLLEQTCPDWVVTYEAGRLMNTKSRQLRADDKFIYIEEFTSGRYIRRTGRPRKEMKRVQIYFCKYKSDDEPNTRDRAGAVDASAELREAVREEIKAQAVNPFLDAFYASAAFLDKPDEVRFAHPLPRFSDREISIMIELDVTTNDQCR